MYQEIIKKIKPEMQKAIAFLEGELVKFRTGRASPALVEDIIVDYLGEKFSLKQLAAISMPEPKQIVIQPWDRSYLEPIEKAILHSGLGFSSVVSQDVIRLSLPPLTEEFRKNIMKAVSEKQEEARRTIRRWREKAWDEVQLRFGEGKIREDDKFRAKEELQKLIDEYNDKIDEIGEKKKKEILE